MAEDRLTVLENDLFSVYHRAGAEVLYETDRGETRRYYAKRYLQALKRAVSGDDLVGFVHRLMRTPQPSRGFFILRAALRLDLSVEALVVDPRKPYHDLFEPDIIEIARHRLVTNGYDPQTGATSRTPAIVPVSEVPAGITSGDLELSALAPGASFDVRVTVREDGTLNLTLL
jgi:hypothetical protein